MSRFHPLFTAPDPVAAPPPAVPAAYRSKNSAADPPKRCCAAAIVATSSPEEARMCHHALLLSEGAMVAYGPPRRLKGEHADWHAIEVKLPLELRKKHGETIIPDLQTYLLSHIKGAIISSRTRHLRGDSFLFRLPTQVAHPIRYREYR